MFLIIISILIVLFIILYLNHNLKYGHLVDEDFYKTLPKPYRIGNFPSTIYISNKNKIPGVFKIVTDVVTNFNKITGFKFFDGPEFLEDQIMSDNFTMVNFERQDHGCSSSFDGKGSVLAHAELPPGRKICFDLDENWTSDMMYYTFYHELMHHLGLRHANHKNSLMYPKYSTNVEGPTEYDLKILKILYPFINTTLEFEEN